ncbi:MAG: sulfite exporter TauE/SafE family protein, partial [Gammaproteobacteria bacterium]
MIDVLMPALLIGLMGSPHCLGMCGGLAALAGQPASGARGPAFILTLHGARLTSYMLLGAVAGLAGQPLRFSPELALVARLFAGGMLIAMGLYLGGWWTGLRRLEAAGGRLWQRLTKGQSRMTTSPLLLGLSWGLLPCGLVYSTLIWSLATG